MNGDANDIRFIEKISSIHLYAAWKVISSELGVSISASSLHVPFYIFPPLYF